MMMDSGSFSAADPCTTEAKTPAEERDDSACSSAMATKETSLGEAETAVCSGPSSDCTTNAAATVSSLPATTTNAASDTSRDGTSNEGSHSGGGGSSSSSSSSSSTINNKDTPRASSPSLASQESSGLSNPSNLSADHPHHLRHQQAETRDDQQCDISDAHSNTLHSHHESHDLTTESSSLSPIPRGPPSPVSPNPDSRCTTTTSTTQQQVVGDTVISPSSTLLTTQHRSDHRPTSSLCSDDSRPGHSSPTSSPTEPTPSSSNSRANSTSRSVSTSTTATADPPTREKGFASLSDTLPPASAPATQTVPREGAWDSRRGLGSRSSSDSAVSEGYLSSRSRQRILAAATDKSTKEGASGRRELLLPKTLSQTAQHHERRDSASNRPPVSYKPPPGGSATQSVPSSPVRVPPIRGFRSSVSRKSLNLDMNFSRPFEFPEGVEDSTHDHTLRALEGRRESDGQMTLPPAGAGAGAEGGAEDEGDMFLRIARQESASRSRDGHDVDDNQSQMSRVRRSSHRRPLSTNVATYTPTSPPQLARRLSDQQETARPKRYLDDRGSEIARSNTTRFAPREKASSVHPGEDLGRLRSSQRPPLTPRASGNSQDSAQDGSYSARRRSSITDSHSGSQARTPLFKSYAFPTQSSASKNYNSSPLVRSFDMNGQHSQERGHGVESTESTLSTAAPSTVWDELDDIRSRINRLELTGKLPSTSGAAVSRLSDERPATAGTTVTTISSSPKRHGTGAAHTEVGSTTSSQREAHPVLNTALTRSKPYLSPGVFRALESAANDAMALSSMMGLPGQAGPISSGASTIGAGTTLTDRQLRRKADSVCRSLTELCVALGEEAPPTKTPQASQSTQNSQVDAPSTPVAPVPYSGGISQRRPSVPAEPSLPKAPASPKAISKFEVRRQTLLNGSLLPSPRVSGSSPSTPVDATPNRRSSLLIGRTRRAGTEEPEDGRASSLVARARRAGTEEPEEGRKTSLLIRSRRGTVGEDDPDAHLRAPSRATTEVNSYRAPHRDYGQAASNTQEATSPGYSALPRRRLPSAINTSRLAAPTSATTSPARRYAERPAPGHDGASYSEAPVESRRISMIGQSSLPARTASLSSRRLQNRDSTVTSISTAATAGGHYE